MKLFGSAPNDNLSRGRREGEGHLLFKRRRFLGGMRFFLVFWGRGLGDLKDLSDGISFESLISFNTTSTFLTFLGSCVWVALYFGMRFFRVFQGRLE